MGRFASNEGLTTSDNDEPSQSYFSVKKDDVSHEDMAYYLKQSRGKITQRRKVSPNQVLTHAARAAAKQLNKLNKLNKLFSHLWWPRAARAKGSG